MQVIKHSSSHTEATLKLKEVFHKTFTDLNFNEPFFNKLVAPFFIELPSHILQQAQTFIKSYYSIVHSDINTVEPANHLEKIILGLQQKNSSVLMGYDFHIDSDQQLRLVEVNTNASAYLILPLLYSATKMNGHESTNYNSLKKSFINEFGEHSLENHLMYIIDENPLYQNMYFEFEMYRSLFQQWGWETYISDYKDLKLKGQQLVGSHGKATNIYNRYCDFLLSDESSVSLLNAYKDKLVQLSPHPKEYLLMADKNRLLDYPQNNGFQDIGQFFIKSYEINQLMESEDLWSHRKKYFFKPKQSHGGKGVYRGKGLTKKVFEQIIHDKNYFAQDYVPPSEFAIDDQTWKIDLRFYVYKDEIQTFAARIYQGQVTNFSNPNSGFMPIHFK